MKTKSILLTALLAFVVVGGAACNRNPSDSPSMPSGSTITPTPTPMNGSTTGTTTPPGSN